MVPTKRDARIAGALYLLSSVPAVFSLQYVPSTLIVSGNPAATASKILGSEMLFRVGIACELITSVMFIFVVRALYKLFSGIDKRQASLMVTLFVVSVPISFLNVLNDIAALTLFRGTSYLAVLDRQQLSALAMLFLRLHGEGVNVAAIFWGLWLFPFGILVIRSGFLPRILGVFLIAGCLGYLADSFTSLLLPSHALLVSQIAIIPEAIGELSIMAWLLIVGVKVKPLSAAATA